MYLTFYVPRRHRLLHQYLTEGIQKLGDVYYEPEFSCGGMRQQHWGQLTYPHVNFQVYPAYVSRRVPILQRYTRERVTILVLPDFPFSGMPKTDLELDITASTRQKKRTFQIVVMSWIWFIFAAVTPIYLIHCMDQMKLGFGSLNYASNWIVYSVCLGVVIPGTSLGINHCVWRRYFSEMTQKGQIAEGPAASSSASSRSVKSDIEVGYLPPTPSKNVATPSS